MRITYDNLNHNALRLIREIIDSPFEYCSEDEDRIRLVIIGYIYGLLEFEKELEKVLKV